MESTTLRFNFTDPFYENYSYFFSSKNEENSATYNDIIPKDDTFSYYQVEKCYSNFQESFSECDASSEKSNFERENKGDKRSRSHPEILFLTQESSSNIPSKIGPKALFSVTKIKVPKQLKQKRLDYYLKCFKVKLMKFFLKYVKEKTKKFLKLSRPDFKEFTRDVTYFNNKVWLDWSVKNILIKFDTTKKNAAYIEDFERKDLPNKQEILSLINSSYRDLCYWYTESEQFNIDAKFEEENGKKEYVRYGTKEDHFCVVIEKGVGNKKELAIYN